MTRAAIRAVPAEPDRWSRFLDVSATLLEQRKLLKRTDTKFLIAAACLDARLEALSADYALLRANGSAQATYQTLYYDTADLRCFNDHRVGRRARHKVRVRHYLDRRVSFLEVKTKTNHNKTDKRRLQRGFGHNPLSSADRRFVANACGIGGAPLMPQLWTNFTRTTLVGLRTAERITIDTQLTFARDGETRSLGGVAIVEIKQARFSARTPAMLVLRSAGCRPSSASKYCTATALLRADVRINRFMPVLRKMEALDAR